MFLKVRKKAFLIVVAAAVLFICCVENTSVEAGAVHIAVLTSQEAEPYREALEGFKHYLRKHKAQVDFKTFYLESDTSQVLHTIEKIKKMNPALIFTLGTTATEAASDRIKDIPIIAGIFLNSDNLKKANATGVMLDFEIETQFYWLHKLLPEAKTIGVIYSPDENQKKIDRAARAAKKMGITLVPEKVSSPQEIPSSLQNVAKRADVLWGISDNLVLTPVTARHILLFSLRNRIPFVGLSTAWVKAGALYALDRDYKDIGMQCGEVAHKVLQGVRAGSIPLAHPRKITYSVNLKSAENLKVEIHKKLINGAQHVF